MHSVTGKFLPSARSVSNFIHGTGVSDLFEPVKSAMVMQWGQVLDHDFAHTPTLKGMVWFMKEHIIKHHGHVHVFVILKRPENNKIYHNKCK